MKHLTPLALALALLPAAHAQPADDPGLPGAPTTSGSPAAEPEEDEAERPVRWTDVGLAVGRYAAELARDGEVTLGNWYTWRDGLATGLDLRFRSPRLEAEAQPGVAGEGPSRYRLDFEDLVGGRVVVDVRASEERLDDLRGRDLEGRVGYRTEGGTGVSFDVRALRDDLSGARLGRYALILEPSALGGEIALGGDSDPLRIGHRIHVGLERVDVDGTGGTRARLGETFEVGTSLFRVRVSSDTALGLTDGGEATLGLSNAVSVWTREPRWGVGVEVRDEREFIDGRPGGLRAVSYSVRGYLRLGPDGAVRLSPSLSVVDVDDRLRRDLGRVTERRLRAALEADWNRAFVGVEVGRDLDGVVRPAVRAGVRIPLGR